MISIEKSTGKALYAGDLSFIDGCLHGDGFMDSRMTPETCEIIDIQCDDWIGGGAYKLIDGNLILTDYGAEFKSDRDAKLRRGEALAQIAALESSITERRKREAILGTDNGWLANIDAQIAALRAQL